jgi:two-component system nitrogen regulation response regulator GlnG
MPEIAEILLVDDDPEVAQAVVNYLPPEKYHVVVVDDGAEVMSAVRRTRPNLILLDVNLPNITGLELLKQIKEEVGDIPIIIVSGYVSTGNAIDAMKDGAFEYLTKPFRLEKLEHTIVRALGQAPASAVRADNDVPLDDDQIIGKSPEIVEIAKIVGRIADSDAPVLVVGETGTGKETVARSVHRNSKRRHGPFVVINCAATSEALLESELFGQDPAGNPSDQAPHIGKFEQADGGTVFLDEVSDLSVRAQSKLLRVLHEGRFERLNGSQTLQVDVRVIAATNRSLVERMKEGQFRVDLFYLLKVVSLFLPPLRERRADIELLAEYFIRKYAARTGRPPKALSQQARDGLLRYSWPGNIRELENAIHTAVVLSKEQELLRDDFPMINEQIENLPIDLENARENYRSLFERIIGPGFDQIAAACGGQVYAILTDAFEQTLIQAALNATDNNQVQAAQLLGISRNTLRERMKRFDLPKRQTESTVVQQAQVVS